MNAVILRGDALRADSSDTPRTLGIRLTLHRRCAPHVMIGGMTETSDLLDLAGLIRSGDARRIREDAGITAGTIAADLGVSAATVSRWETGTHPPTREHAIAWLRVLRQIGAAS